MILIDTSAVIEFLRGTELGEKIQAHIEDEAIAISSITYNELLMGSKMQDSTLDFLNSIEVIDFGREAATAAAILEKRQTSKGKPIGKIDCLIAGTALSKNISLLTTDKNFKNIKELKLILLN